MQCLLSCFVKRWWLARHSSSRRPCVLLDGLVRSEHAAFVRRGGKIVPSASGRDTDFCSLRLMATQPRESRSTTCVCGNKASKQQGVRKQNHDKKTMQTSRLEQLQYEAGFCRLPAEDSAIQGLQPDTMRFTQVFLLQYGSSLIDQVLLILDNSFYRLMISNHESLVEWTTCNLSLPQTPTVHQTS